MQYVTIFDEPGFDYIADVTSFENIIPVFEENFDNATVLGGIDWSSGKDVGSFEFDVEGDCYTAKVYRIWVMPE